MRNSVPDKFLSLTYLLSILEHFLERAAPPQKPDLHDFTLTASILVIGLVAVIPVLSLGVGHPVLATVLVPLFGLLYFSFIYATDRLFEGFVSGFFVFSIFNARMNVLAAPGNRWLMIFLVDFIALALFGILLYEHASADVFQFEKVELVAISGLAVFVLWSFLSALVGNGASSLLAVVFAIDQFRYLFIFVLAILVVKQTSFWCAAYPLLLSIGGNLLYALAEVVNGDSIDLKYLGTESGRLVEVITLGPIDLQIGYYAGGFVGWGRALLAVLLLFLPFLVFWTVYGSRRRVITSVAGIAAVMLLVRVANTDSGWMATLLALAVAGVAALSLFVQTFEKRYFNGVVASGFGIGMSLLLYSSRWLRDSETGSADVQKPSLSTDQSPVHDFFFDVFAWVPLVSASSLGIRFDQYIVAIELALKYPVFGVGGYNYYLLSELYGLPSAYRVHNTFLSHLAATGFPGFFAYTISVVAVLWIIVRRVWQTSNESRFLWLCLLAGLLGFHAYSFWVVIFGWHSPMVGFWALSGIIVGSDSDPIE